MVPFESFDAVFYSHYDRIINRFNTKHERDRQTPMHPAFTARQTYTL